MRLWKPPKNALAFARERVGSVLAELMDVKREPDPLPVDPWEFVSKCVYTQDEHAARRGLPVVRKLVADEGDEYLKVLTREFTREPKTAASKARQLRVTWLLAALMLHDALMHRGHRNGYQAKKWDDAAAYLEDRFWFIYLHIPGNYAKPAARHVEGLIEIFHDGADTLATAWVMAFAEGAEQVRQWTLSWFWGDEFAWQMDQDDTLTALQPSLDGGGRGTLTSSPRRGSHMGKLLREDVASGPVEPEKPIYKDSILAWRRNGFRCLQIEYWADPTKARMWPDRDTPPPGYSTRQWRQEQRNDWTVQSGDPFYCDTANIVRRPQLFNPRLPLCVAWDFGLNHPCAGFFQIDPPGWEWIEPPGWTREGFRPNNKLPRLRGLMTLRGRKLKIERFAQERVIPKLDDLFPGAQVHHYGDPAGNNREGTSGKSAIEVLGGLGIHVRTQREKVDVSADLMQTVISLWMMELDPTGCRHLIDDVDGGYYQDEDGLPVKDDECDHEPDLTRYLIWNTLRYGAEGEPRICMRVGADSRTTRPGETAPRRR